MSGQRPGSLFLLVLGLITILASPVSASSRNCPSDPYLDPKTDICNPLRYITTNALSGVAIALVVLIALTQSYWVKKWGAKWMLALVIGEYTYAVGFGLRFGLHYNPDSSAIYIAEYMFIVLSPCAFIAADYVLLGRIARYLERPQYLLINARRITIIFVSSDISTFLIQAAGGGISTSTTVSTALAGSHIFLAGLALQLASFAIFTCIFATFVYRIRKYDPEIWTRDAGLPWYKDWRSLCGALAISCVGILIRSVYRVAELSQGYLGHLATTEAFFYGLDTLPLLIAIYIYVPFWPGRFIPRDWVPVVTTQEDTLEQNLEKQL